LWANDSIATVLARWATVTGSDDGEAVYCATDLLARNEGIANGGIVTSASGTTLRVKFVSITTVDVTDDSLASFGAFTVFPLASTFVSLDAFSSESTE